MLFKKSALLMTLAASIASLVNAANLSGSASITPQDYIGLPAAALANNPPACGMPYNQLNLARITAVANMNTGSTCNLCLKVVNSKDTSKFVYVLAVDLGGSGLDLSIPSFEYLFGQRYDASPASWTTVASSYCEGIYTPGKVNTNQGLAAGSSSSSTTTTTKKTTTTKTTTTKTATKTATKTTTTKEVTTTTKKITTSSTRKSTSTTTKKPSTTTSTKKSKTTNTKKSTSKRSASSKKSRTRGPWWKATKRAALSPSYKTKKTRSHRIHGEQKRRQS